jgi:hypothetical protein
MTREQSIEFASAIQTLQPLGLSRPRGVKIRYKLVR